MEIIQDFKIIWEYLSRYKKAVIKTAVLAMVGSIFTAIIPYIYGKLVDIVSIEISDLNFILALLGVWIVTSLCSAFFDRMVSVRGGFIASNILGDFIYKKSNHIINLPLSFHKEKKLGEILSKITRGGEHIREIVDLVAFFVFPHFLTIFVGISILFFIDWRLSSGTLFLVFISIFITAYRMPLVFQASREWSKKSEEGLGILNDSFLNIQTIKSCSAENFQKEKIRKSYKEEINSAFKNLVILWDNTVLVQKTVFYLGFVIIFGYAIFLLKFNQISNGELVMFLGYLNLTKHPLFNLLWQWLDFEKGITVIKRARVLSRIKTENYKGKGKILKKVKGKVEFKNVCFSYKKREWILKKINFKVEPGQKIAIVGGSGEGKTTLADLISLYFIPNKGKILIDGVNIKEMNLKFLRKIIAYVPQEIILFNDTIKNNILYGKPEATSEEIIEATKASNAHNFIERFPQKYEQLVGERGIRLSTGQKQRLAIARAVIRDPKILVLDEATSSLDVESEKLVQEALDNLIKNRTTFIIAHRLSTVKNADKILVLEKGRIIEAGNHKELIKKRGRYYKFYSLQFKI